MESEGQKKKTGKQSKWIKILQKQANKIKKIIKNIRKFY